MVIFKKNVFNKKKEENVGNNSTWIFCFVLILSEKDPYCLGREPNTAFISPTTIGAYFQNNWEITENKYTAKGFRN